MLQVSVRKALLTVGVVLALMPAPLFGAPAPEEADKDPRSAAEKVRDKLNKPVNFTAEANWTLRDSLEWLTIRYALKISIDTPAFEASKCKDVQGANIARDQAWNANGSSLKEVLRKILCNLPETTSDATYVIIGDTIIITTDEYATYRWMRQSVEVECEKEELSLVMKKLARETGTNLVIDPRAAKQAQTAVTMRVLDMPLEKAVTLLADMADLKPVRVGNVLLLTTKAHAKELRDDKERAHVIGPCPLPGDKKVPPLP